MALLPYSGRRHAEPVPGEPALAVESATVRHASDGRTALDEVSLLVPEAARVALVGPNGAGKSTLLKAVAGLLPAAGGRVRVYGNPVGACHHRVAYLPQRGEIDWRFPVSVRRLVMGGRYVHLGWLGRPGERDRDAVEEALERLGLSGLAGRQIGRLSGGQRQRALLARSLAQESDLLLLDEPLTAVDSDTRRTISEVLAGLREQGKSVIVATHDLAGLSREFEGALYLRDGREEEPDADAFVGLRVGAAAWAG